MLPTDHRVAPRMDCPFQVSKLVINYRVRGLLVRDISVLNTGVPFQSLKNTGLIVG